MNGLRKKRNPHQDVGSAGSESVNHESKPWASQEGKPWWRLGGAAKPRVPLDPNPLSAGPNDQRPNTRADVKRHSKDTPTVILIGDAGVGKSSIINMLSGSPEGLPKSASVPGNQAKVDGNMVGCTKEPRPYRKYAGDRPFCLYDTAGLNEPANDDATVTPARAAKQISDLLADLAQGGGISFVFFVLAMGRFTLAQANNYRFARLLCGPDVPIILIVTKEDTHTEGGKVWLEDAKPRFEKQGIHFADFIFITASPGQGGRSEDKYQESILSLREFVKKHLDVDTLATYSINPSSLPEQVFRHIANMVAKALQPTDFQRELTSLLMRAYMMRWRDADEIADAHRAMLWFNGYRKEIAC